MHKPGIPAGLLPPEELWARWGLAAVLGADAREEGDPFRFGLWAEPGTEPDADTATAGGTTPAAGGTRLRYDDAGCSRWWFVRCGDGRYVLFGSDDASELARYTEPSVDQDEPALDRFAGAPGWLPAEVFREVGNSPDACVYWYEDGAWARADYPEELEDDGVAVGLGWLHDRERFLGALATWDGEPQGVALPEALAERLLDAARERRVTSELLESAAAQAGDEDAAEDDLRELDLPAALRASEISGLGGGR